MWIYCILNILLLYYVCDTKYLSYDEFRGKSYNISYNDRSFMINNQRTLLFSGTIHYPRLSPGQWKPMLMKFKNDGLNTIQTYTFWNLHEPVYDFSGKHEYIFDGRANLTQFLSVAAEVGLFVNIRVGCVHTSVFDMRIYWYTIVLL